MQLALAADIDPTYLSAVEQGRRNISLVNIHALAGTLNISVRDFFGPEVPSSEHQGRRRRGGSR